MRFARNVVVEMTAVSQPRGILFQGLLQEFLKARFEPQAVRQALERHNASLEAPLLRPAGVEDGGMLVAPSVLFPSVSHWKLLIEQRATRLSTPLDEQAVWHVADFLRMAARAQTLEELRAGWLFDEDSWQDSLFAPKPEAPGWPEPTGPGIYRREHASLLIRSRTTSILVDPIPLQRRLPHIHGAPGNVPEGGVDAVAITHGHDDHWHLSSLLSHLPGPEVPVLVPRVPRPNLLNPVDFARTLAGCGQRVLAPAWGETLQIGDIRVDVLPFYGEQPVPHDSARLPEGLRSWGNCYRFTTEDFSCLVLVDSGADPEGSMVEVAARGLERFGPTDLVLGCQREFYSPFFGGLSLYWAALPWSQLRELYTAYVAGRLTSGTAGPSGLAAVCAAAGARYFLPYANGFEGMGRPIQDVGWGDGEPSEARCGEKMRELLAREGAGTQVLDWLPGDVARFERGQLTLEHRDV